MRKVSLFLVIYLISTVCIAQDTIPVWNKQLINTFMGKNFLKTDKFNNSFVLVDFYDSLTIGDSTFVNTNKKILSSVLLKYDNNSNLSWMYPMVNKTNIRSSDLEVDNNGGCYIAGRYFGNFPISSTTTLDSTAMWGRSFFVHFKSNGQLDWAKGFPNASILLLTTSQNGNIFVKRNMSNGSYQIGDSLFPYTTNETIAKFDASGKFYWAKTFAPSDGFIADPFDNIYIYNDFISKITVDTFQLTPKNTKRAEFFIAKINPMLEVKWVKQIENGAAFTSTLGSLLLTSDNVGNIYFSSVFRDSLSLLGNKYYSPQYNKLFFTKIDANGNFIWVKVPVETQPISEGVGSFKMASSNKLKGKIQISSETNFNGHVVTNLNISGAAFIEMDTNGMVSNLSSPILSIGSFAPGSGSSYFQLGQINKNDSIKVQGKYYKAIKKSDLFLVKYDTSHFSSIEPKNNILNNVVLFPNPANAVFYVSSKNEPIIGLQVYNSLGELTYNLTNLNSNQLQLNAESYPKGIYFVKIKTNSNQFVIKKLVVK